MADEITPRIDTDPAARVAQDLRARLRAMPQAELVELCAQLLATYVIEGVLPLSHAAEAGEMAADLGGEETFAQMLKRLKTSKAGDPVLDRFFIDGENISVRIDGQGVMPITQYRRPIAPPSAPGQPPAPQTRRETVPGASTSIYNRALYEEERQAGQPPPGQAAPSRAAPAPRPLPSPSPVPAASPAPSPGQPAAPAGQQPKKDEQPKNDRFTLIELE